MRRTALPNVSRSCSQSVNESAPATGEVAGASAATVGCDGEVVVSVVSFAYGRRDDDMASVHALYGTASA